MNDTLGHLLTGMVRSNGTVPIWDDTAQQWLNVPAVRKALERRPADVESEPAIHAGGHQTAGSSRAPGATARSEIHELAGAASPLSNRLPDRGARKHPASFLPARAPLEFPERVEAMLNEHPFICSLSIFLAGVCIGIVGAVIAAFFL